ncbi:unnamed protein product [Gongylonema pulchrum]|uniref:Large ribosomal subunit protein uL10m n=1 Tax=Gongylonema pulchrum TaxID=637853 RepID=A0A183EHH9_9BILA|nr:unnamed protein product [Gongylonema pulchrum]
MTSVRRLQMRMLERLIRLVPGVSLQMSVRELGALDWPIKRPRPYRRRLFDAALAPMAPRVRKMCPSFKEVHDYFKELKSSYSEWELALVAHIRGIIKKEGYQVMGICHRLATKQRTEWLTRNQLRLKGLEFRDYGNRIIRKVFEDTPLQPLNDTIFVATNCQLFGKDINALRAMITECEKIDWLMPIAVVYGSRILSISEVKELCKLPSFEDHRAQTVQLLSRPSMDLISTISYHTHDLIRTLEMVGKQKTST